MVPIILGSIIASGFVIERSLFFWKIRIDIKKFSDEIFFLLGKGEFARALEVCGNTAHPLSDIFRTGLERRDGNILDIERAMEREGNRQIAALEKNLNYLMVIVGVEPLLGFLGTILGLIQAFMNWETHAASVTVDQLAAGIYQAMITTAGGLLVAIPFYIIYHFFLNKINSITRELNQSGDEFLTILNEFKKSP